MTEVQEGHPSSPHPLKPHLEDRGPLPPWVRRNCLQEMPSRNSCLTHCLTLLRRNCVEALSPRESINIPALRSQGFSTGCAGIAWRRGTRWVRWRGTWCSRCPTRRTSARWRPRARRSWWRSCPRRTSTRLWSSSRACRAPPRRAQEPRDVSYDVGFKACLSNPARRRRSWEAHKSAEKKRQGARALGVFHEDSEF